MDLVRRAGWGAADPTKRTPLARPDGVGVHWNGTKVGSHHHRSCAALVRSIQRYHMAPKPKGQGWADIAYTAVVCEHGTVFEGRGLGHRTAANGTDDANDRFYALMYLGGEGDPLTAEGMRGLRDARRWLMDSGGAGPLVRPHRSFKDTTCPGDELCARLAELSTPPSPPVEDDVRLHPDDIEKIAQRAEDHIADGRNPYGTDALRRQLDAVGGQLADLAAAVQRLEVQLGDRP